MRYARVKDGKVIGVAEVRDDEGGRAWLATANNEYDAVIDVTEHLSAHGYGVNAGDDYLGADGFRPVAPFPSWSWGGTKWEPPVPRPTDGGTYVWDEAAGQWHQTAPPPVG